MPKHERMFSLLEEILATTPHAFRSRHVAAIMHKKTVLALGFNEARTHPMQRRFNYHCEAIFKHAETAAIARVISRHGAAILPKCRVYVARVKYKDSEKSGLIRGSSCPCEGCLSTLRGYGVKAVYYTLNNEGYGVLKP